jgi:hypothetical protein
MELLVPVSAGELLDKITILQIKAQRIGDAAKRANVAVELAALEAVAVRAGLVAESGQAPGPDGVFAPIPAVGAGSDGGGDAVADGAGQAALAPVLAQLATVMAQLVTVNGELWEIEDRIRDCERAGDFGSGFVELARAVYRTNDRRAALKAQINQLCGSQLVEEKSYAAY